MKFNYKKPYLGQKRTIDKFALFPIYDEKNQRYIWLEKYQAIQEFMQYGAFEYTYQDWVTIKIVPY